MFGESAARASAMPISSATCARRWFQISSSAGVVVTGSRRGRRRAGSSSRLGDGALVERDPGRDHQARLQPQRHAALARPAVNRHVDGERRVQPGRRRLVVAGAQVLDGDAELHADAGEQPRPPLRAMDRPPGDRPRRQPERDADAIGEPRQHDAVDRRRDQRRALRRQQLGEPADAPAPQELRAGAERDRRAAVAVRLDAEERVHVERQRPGHGARLHDLLERQRDRRPERPRPGVRGPATDGGDETSEEKSD